MSAQGPWTGASPGGPPIRPGSSAYYNPAPPPQTVVVFQPPASTGATFDLKAFGEKRFYALLGAVIGVVGVFQPWISMGFIGVSATGLMQLLSMVGSANAQGGAMLLGALMSIIGVAVAALVLLFKRDEKSLNGAGLCGLLAIIGAIVFIAAFVSIPTGGFGGPGIGYGVYMTIVGGAVIVWGTKNAVMEERARQSYGAAAAWGGVPPRQPQIVMQAAPAYAPAYRPAPPPTQQMSNCPTCGAGVPIGAPRCNACGLALVWS